MPLRRGEHPLEPVRLREGVRVEEGDPLAARRRPHAEVVPGGEPQVDLGADGLDAGVAILQAIG